MFFIVLNHNLSKEFDLNIKVGETKKLENFEINFQNLNIENKKNYDAIVGNFNIHNTKKNYKKNLKPEIRVYEKPETLTFETAIISNFKQDFYLTMSNIDGSEFYNVKFQLKPLMLWIWLEAFLTARGSLVRIFLKNENKYHKNISYFTYIICNDSFFLALNKDKHYSTKEIIGKN